MRQLDYLAPGLALQPGAPMPEPPRRSLQELLDELVKAAEFAKAHHLAVLTIGADRFGVFVVVAPVRLLYTLFGDECTNVRQSVQGAMRSELWLGKIGETRFFWTEVKACVQH